MNCIKCGIEFDPLIKRNRLAGKINECSDCGRLSDRGKPARTLGIQGGEGINKSANISIVRNPSKSMARWVRNISKSPFNANLPLSGYSFIKDE